MKGRQAVCRRKAWGADGRQLKSVNSLAASVPKDGFPLGRPACHVRKPNYTTMSKISHFLETCFVQRKPEGACFKMPCWFYLSINCLIDFIPPETVQLTLEKFTSQWSRTRDLRWPCVADGTLQSKTELSNSSRWCLPYLCFYSVFSFVSSLPWPFSLSLPSPSLSLPISVCYVMLHMTDFQSFIHVSQMYINDAL